MAEGVMRRHSAPCASRAGKRCDCNAGWEASVYIAREQRKLRKTFPTKAAARSWRAAALREAQSARLRGPSSLTVRQAADDWLEAARSGLVRNRSGDVYKPSVLRSYDQALRLRVLPAIGPRKLGDVTTGDLQELVERWQAQALDASTIRSTLLPLRVVYRRALVRGQVAVNPCAGVHLPAVRGKRDRIASSAEAALLLDALPARERPLWAAALYSGLRRGELMALRWEDVDLAAGVIHVRASWDLAAGRVEPKSTAGKRRVPITARLRDVLVEHRMATGGQGEALVFQRDGGGPFVPDTVSERARRAWKAAKLTPIALHECRHTFASLMIAAGVNAKALSTYLGHANISITFDRYGHLMPGNENEAAGLLDAYLQRADTAARLADFDAAAA
jgi:integrase